MKTFLQKVTLAGGNPEAFWLGFSTWLPDRIDSSFSPMSKHYGWDPHPVGWNACGVPLAMRQKLASERAYPPGYEPGGVRSVYASLPLRTS